MIRSYNRFTRVRPALLALPIVGVIAATTAWGQDGIAPAAEPLAAAPAARIPKVVLSRVWPRLALVRPVQMLQSPNDANKWFILEQPGRIRLADMRERELSTAPIAVDLTDRVNATSNEEGLLSAAFHPAFASNRHLYVYYSANPPRRTVLSRFTVSEDGAAIDPGSEEVILEVEQPYWNHNGGTVLFGPDGMLYLSIGDGGSANDPKGNGQNLGTLLASIIRIDVNKGEEGKRYAIPADNPFVGREGARGEIWAYGLRNVWRMHFDRQTGELWAGDVGQNLYEEIDLITKGGNYGWNKREGLHDFKGGKDKTGLIDPVVEYHHRDGISVTGGFVYRGENPALQGVYLYADFVYGVYWGIRMVDGKPTEPKVLCTKRGSLPSSFAEASDGTLYVLTFEGGQGTSQSGAVWRIVPE